MNTRTVPLFACAAGIAQTTEAVAMVVKAVIMRGNMANKMQNEFEDEEWV